MICRVFDQSIHAIVRENFDACPRIVPIAPSFAVNLTKAFAVHVFLACVSVAEVECGR